MAEQGTKRRTTLTREAILDAAMRLCAPDGGGVLTFSRLGKELGADPTAVYRHFRDKDELVLALADRVIGEAQELARQLAPDLRPDGDHWREWLGTTARAVRTAHLARPALAVLTAVRTTASADETTSVENIIAVLHQAGLPVIEAAEVFRAMMDMTLAFIQASATFMTLEPEVQAKDEAAWAVKYGLLPAEEHPLLHASAPRLTELFSRDDEVFDLALETYLDGIALKLDRARAAG